MARKADQKAVTAKMYRHFAVVTVIATAALAMAADGSNSEKLNAEVAAKQAKVIAAGKDIKKNNQATVIKRSGKPANAASGWGSDEGGDSGSGGESSSYLPADFGANAVSDDMLRKLGLTRSQFMALPPQTRQQMLNRATGNTQPYVAPAVQARQQQATVNASLARSGFEGPCNDC